MAKGYTVKKLHISNSGNSTKEDYERLISQTPVKHFINECLFESIHYAHTKKRKFAQFLEISGSGRILKIEKKDWKPALEKMLPEYVKLEEYKLCSSIRDLINMLD